jgi:hypothetical protein
LRYLTADLHFMKILSLTIFHSLLLLFTSAQTPDSVYKSIYEAEVILKSLGDSIVRGHSERTREGALAEFNPRFYDLLSNAATFNYPFDSLKTLSKLITPDKSTRIFTWVLPSYTGNAYKYYGLIQRINPRTKSYKVIGMQELKITNEEAENSELKTDSWYGAIYYDVIEKKYKKKTQYVLLGWQGNDLLTNRKVIDLIYFDEWDNVTYGAPVFKEDNKLKYRVIFEFTSSATMLLRYEARKKMIVFDHLSPSSPAAKGQYRFYGPDFTYDGFVFRKGYWLLKTNLDLRNSPQRK